MPLPIMCYVSIGAAPGVALAPMGPSPEELKKKADDAARAKAAAAAPVAAARPSAAPSSSSGGDLPVTRPVLTIPPAPPGEDYIASTVRHFTYLESVKVVPKTLQRPPLRFIHDIVTNTLKQTGRHYHIY
jgi:Ni,Fe-hydrogenase I small subunit